jgi:hypothetical protein
MPAPEAERYAMILAEALRKIHDAGQVHGSLSPASIVLIGAGLELLPPAHTEGTITPYTAPELLQGRPADYGSDVFAFGAVVYEMFSGRRAFEGDGPAALSAAINTSMPPSCGSPAVDRLLSNCLAKDPAARWQRMHKILMELKLLTVLARRAEAPPSVRREQAGAAVLRAEMQQLEGRVAARLQAIENTVANTDHAASELRGQLASVNAQFTSVREQQVSIFEGLVEAAEARVTERFGRDAEATGERFGRLEQALKAVDEGFAERLVRDTEATGERVARLEQALKAAEVGINERFGRDTEATGERVGRLEQVLEAAEARILERLGRDTEAAGERVGRLEQALEAAEARILERLGRDTEAAGERFGHLELALEAARKHTTTLHESVSEDFLTFEQGLKSQTAAIESTRMAMAQTDDLVERVVDALESLQSFVLDLRGDPTVAVN